MTPEPLPAASGAPSGPAAPEGARGGGPLANVPATIPAVPDEGDRASLQSAPAVGNAPPFDPVRVSRLRMQIAAGQYTVDSRATAGAMLSQLVDFRGIA